MSIDLLPALRPVRAAWNKWHIVGQKRPPLPRHVWSIRVRLEMVGNARDLALFNLAVPRKRAPAIAKYRNLAGDETWSGHGRKPSWFVEALKGGTFPEDMLF